MRAVARGLWSRRRRLGVGWLEAGQGRTRARGAIIARLARLSARFLCALECGYGGDDSLALGVSAVASVCFEMTARRAVARGLGSRRRRLDVGWLEAGRGRTRARGAIIARPARLSARFLCTLDGGYGGDDSLALGVSAVASVCFEVTARRAVARGLWSRRRRLGVGWLEAGRGRTRARGAIIARPARLSARFLCTLDGGYGGDDSLALGVSAVASVCFEVTARRAVARGLGSRRRRLGVGWLEAGRGRTRARGAIIARPARLSARFLCALDGGYGGDDSLALGVSAVVW